MSWRRNTLLLCCSVLVLAECGKDPLCETLQGQSQKDGIVKVISSPLVTGETNAQVPLAEGPVLNSVSSRNTGPASFNEAHQILGDVMLSDNQRVVAARELPPDELVRIYGERDNARIVRQIIDQKVANRDKTILPLLVGLFKVVGGEERIDFEHYILVFGRAAEKDMIVMLESENHHLVMRAMDTLAKMHSPLAVNAIASLLMHSNAWVRIGAAHAIGELGGPEAAERLVGILDDPVYSVVNAALVGLGRLRAVAAYEQIAALLNEDNKHIRKHAVMALGELGLHRSIPAIHNLVREDPDAGVRFAAGMALKKLESKQ